MADQSTQSATTDHQQARAAHGAAPAPVAVTPAQISAINQRLFETSLDLILVVDRHGTFVRVSPSAQAIIGYDPLEMVGHSAAEFIHPDDLNPTREEMRQARRGRVMRQFGCRYVHKQGHIVPLSWTGVWSEPAEQHFFIGRDISEMRATEQRLRDSERRFRDFAEVSADWIWETDAQHRFTLVEGGAADDLPVPPAAAVGQTRWECMNADPARDELWARHKADLDARRPFRQFRFSVPKPDGGQVHISVSGKPVFDDAGTFLGYRGTSTDESSIMQARERAERAEAQLWDAIQSVSEGFAIYDDGDRLAMCNAVYRDLFSDDAAGILPGIHYADLLRNGLAKGHYPEAEGREAEWLSERLRQRREAQGDSELAVRDGRWVLLGERRMSNGWLAASAVEITALKAAQHQLAEGNRHLREARDARTQAETANQAKSRFLATASHDLRQPLHAMNLFVSALRRRVSGDEAARLVNGMSTAIDSMLGMFNAVLDVSKLEAGAVTPNFSDTALDDVLERLRASFAGPAAAKGLEFEIESCDAAVRTDPVLLESVLRNLLSNAVRYTRQGEVLLRCVVEPTVVRVEVHDTGPGIPATEHEHIFEEFHRLNTSGTTERGLGLGLAIVRRQAELLGTHIELRSELGVGSVFSLIVPRAAAAADIAPPAIEASPLVGRRLLLVEDDPLVRTALVGVVADWGAIPLAAGNAEEALALVTASTTPPDLAIVDRDLGGAMSGPALLDLLRDRMHLAIPAMIVTGATDPATLAALRQSGYHWITKPVDADVLQGAAIELLAAAVPTAN